MGSSEKSKLRFLYVLWGFLECIGFGGLIFGWGSFVYVLKDEGFYQDLCHNVTINSTHEGESTVDCPERDSRLELVFTIGSMCAGVGSFVLGQINYKFGMRTARIVASLLFMSGAFMVAFTTIELQWLIFPGMALTAFGGMGMLLTNIQLSNLFITGGGTVVGIICGAFDTSAGIQLMVKLGYENGISRKTSFIILASTHVLTFISTFMFLPKDYVHPVLEEYVVNQEIEMENKEKNSTNDTSKDVDKQSSETNDLDNDPTSFGKLKKHLLSPTFSLHVVWLCLLQLRFFFLLGSINRILVDELAVKEKVSEYTNVMLYILMGGLLASPLSGAFLELNVSLFKKSRSSFCKAVLPTVIPLALTTTLCLVLSILVLLEDPDYLYYIFALMLIFRSMFYTIGNAFIIRSFPSVFIGSMIGIATIFSGVFSLLQHALFEWSSSRNPREVNIFLIVMTCLSYVHPIWQWIDCRKAERKEKS
ncbi:hypothetical protein Btru_073451 [Bulinus truncatus]|nr:hypothetical protein Btru_073451 [Bulinus truncatus]